MSGTPCSRDAAATRSSSACVSRRRANRRTRERRARTSSLDRRASARRSATTRCVYHDVRPEQQQDERGDQQLGLAAAHAGQLRTSTPRYGRSTSGTVTVPSGVLVVLEQAGDRARKRQPRSVERVHEPRLLALRRPIANVRAPRLEVGEVAARRHLEPRADARRPRLEIVRHRRAEAGVARREQLAAIRQPESLEHRLGVAREQLELRRPTSRASRSARAPPCRTRACAECRACPSPPIPASRRKHLLYATNAVGNAAASRISSR